MRCFAGMALCRTGLRSGYTGRHCTCCGWAFPFAATLRLRFRRVQSTGPATRRTALGATFGGNHQGNFDGTLTDNVMQFLCASSLIVGVMACILRRASCKPTSGAHLVRTAIGTRLDIYIRRAGEQSELVLSCFSPALHSSPWHARASQTREAAGQRWSSGSWSPLMTHYAIIAFH